MERKRKCELSIHWLCQSSCIVQRDLASDASREQEIEDASNAVPSGHPWAHTVGQAKKCRHLEAGRGITCGGATEARTTAMARPCAVDA